MATTRPRWLRPRQTSGGGTSTTGSGASRPAGGITEQRRAELPSGIVPYVFGIDNLAASITAAQLYRAFPGAAATFAQVPIQPLFRGSIVAMALRANAAKTAGVATFEGYVAGVASGAQLSWGNDNKALATFAEGLFIFEAEDEVDVRVTTNAAYAPTTSDLELILYIAQTTTEAVPV